jgi:hypothetical protein
VAVTRPPPDVSETIDLEAVAADLGFEPDLGESPAGMVAGEVTGMEDVTVRRGPTVPSARTSPSSDIRKTFACFTGNQLG